VDGLSTGGQCLLEHMQVARKLRLAVVVAFQSKGAVQTVLRAAPDVPERNLLHIHTHTHTHTHTHARTHARTHTHMPTDKQQVCVQLPTYADNVALPALARRAPLLQQSRNCHRAHSSKPAAASLLLWDRHWRTD